MLIILVELSMVLITIKNILNTLQTVSLPYKAMQKYAAIYYMTSTAQKISKVHMGLI
jgi:hypothetical protein